MKLFKLIFSESFNKFYHTIVLVGFITLFLSSCSSQKESSLAYMDDIYYDTYSTPMLVTLSSELEEGEAPTNVPGAAYVYTPIPEPTLTTPSTDNLSPYFGDRYYGDGSGGSYSTVGAGFAYNALYWPFNWPSIYGTGGAVYYPNDYCPTNINPYNYNDSYISSKRFSWGNASNDSYQYSTNTNLGTSSNTASSSSNTREKSTKKSTFWNSLISTESTGNNSKEYNSRSSGSSRSGSATPSRSSSSSSSGSSRSSGSSKSYSGKRKR